MFKVCLHGWVFLVLAAFPAAAQVDCCSQPGYDSGYYPTNGYPTQYPNQYPYGVPNQGYPGYPGYPQGQPAYYPYPQQQQYPQNCPPGRRNRSPVIWPFSQGGFPFPIQFQIK